MLLRTDSIERVKATPERRIAAPHPGPMLKREYVDPLGLDIDSLASHLGVEPGALGAMLEGRTSIDVETAVRIARALQIPADRIVQMQIRSDFAALRDRRALEDVAPLLPAGSQPFPARHLCGHLGRSIDGHGNVDSFFFQEQLARPVADDGYAGLHALWRGDRVRVYDSAGAVLWIGPVLADLDGRTLLPYVPTATWHGWFGSANRADLALGAEHTAYLASFGSS